MLLHYGMSRARLGSCQVIITAQNMIALHITNLTNYIARSQGQHYNLLSSRREENWDVTTRNKVFLIIKTESKIP